MTTRLSTAHFLKQPLCELGFSDQFVRFCAKHQWFTPGDILRLPLDRLLEYPGFSDHCLPELREHLRERGQLYLFTFSGS